jgi:hypothetical protein
MCITCSLGFLSLSRSTLPSPIASFFAYHQPICVGLREPGQALDARRPRYESPARLPSALTGDRCLLPFLPSPSISPCQHHTLCITLLAPPTQPTSLLPPPLPLPLSPSAAQSSSCSATIDPCPVMPRPPAPSRSPPRKQDICFYLWERSDCFFC